MSQGAANVATGDINGDGRKDVIATNRDVINPGIDVFLQQPDGSLGSPAFYATPPNAQTTVYPDVAVGDLNGDGLLDIAVSSGRQVDVFFQQADHTLPTTPVPVAVAPDFTFVRQVLAADVTGDGKADLVSLVSPWTEPPLNPIGIVYTSWTGSAFGAATRVTLLQEWAMRVGDVTGDGKPDVVALGTGEITNTRLQVFAQQAGGTFLDHGYAIPNDTYPVADLALGDLNHDGRKDVVVSEEFLDRVAVLRQSIGGTLGSPYFRAADPSLGPITASDLNRDGRADVVATRSGWPNMSVFVQQTTGVLGAQLRFPECDCFDAVDGVTIGDVNGDGFPDVVIANGVGARIVLQEKRADTLTLSAPISSAPGNRPALSGKLSMADGSSPGGKTISLSVTPPGGLKTTFATVKTGTGGAFTATAPVLAATGYYVYSAFFAGDTLHRAATAIRTVLSTVVTLALSAATVTYGAPVTLTAHLVNYRSTTNLELSIYETPYGGSKSLVASGNVGSSGNLVAVVSPAGNTSFVAEWNGDSTHGAISSLIKTVLVRSITHGVLSGYYRISSGYRLYHYSSSCVQTHTTGCPHYTVTVIPNHAGHAVCVYLQAYHSGAWHASGSTCPTLDGSSQVLVSIFYGGTGIKGIPLRVMAKFAADADHLPSGTPWLYLKITS